jgi:peptide/nickel transport system ATP-binding protein
MVFQSAAASFDPHWSIGRAISEPIVAYRLRTGKVGIKDCAIQTMAVVGLPEQLVDRRPGEVTDAQLQCASVARALVGEPELLICDEPTAALDITMQAVVLNALREAQARARIGMLIASRDIGLIRHMSDLVAVMLRGRVVEFGLAADVFATPRHPYTQALFDSLPALSAPRASVRTGPTDPLPPLPAAGLCAFGPRCPMALPRCRTEPPPLVDVGGVAVACHALAAAA